jgi:ADP-ribose pyrophosphatase
LGATTISLLTFLGFGWCSNPKFTGEGLSFHPPHNFKKGVGDLLSDNHKKSPLLLFSPNKNMVLYSAYINSYPKSRHMKKVIIEQKRNVLDDFFKVEEAYLQFEKFDGEMTGTIRRFNLERGNSVSVLTYNRQADKLILVTQFRYPTYKNGHGWTIEAIAGMIDPGETPEEAARREVEEETGLKISVLEHITTFYPSPGGTSELIFLYYSEVSGQPIKKDNTGGFISEGEDIMSLEISLEEALKKIKTGEIMDAKTIIGIYWLENQLITKSRL